MARALTPRQAAFCRHMLEPGITAKQAAIQAGYSESYAESHVDDILGNPRVQARLKELETRVDHEYVVTRADVRRGLHHEAQEAESPSARVRAWELLGKDAGMFVERQEVTLKRDPREMSRDELGEYLRARGLLD